MPDDPHAATPPDDPGHPTRKDLQEKATEAMPRASVGLLPGEFLTRTPDAEPLRLGSILGQGGMAIVYEGHDPVLDRPVAVKVMRPEFSSDADLRARFF